MSRFDDQPFNMQPAIWPQDSMEFPQAQGRVEPQGSLSFNRTIGLHQQGIISQPTGSRDNKEAAQIGVRAKLEALSAFTGGVEFDHQQCITSAPTGPRNSKEFAQAQALAKLEALSERNSGTGFDHQQRTTLPPAEPQNSKEFAQAQTLAKLEGLSAHNSGIGFDHQQRPTAPPTGSRSSKESAQAQARAELEASSTSSDQGIRCNLQQHTASPPVGSQNNSKFVHRRARAKLLIESSISTYDIIDNHHLSAAPAKESKDSIEFASISPNLQPPRKARHQAPSSSRVIISVISQTSQGSFAPRDTIGFGLIPSNLQTRKTGRPKASSSSGKKSVHPLRHPSVRRSPRILFTSNVLGSSMLHSARKVFGRSKKGSPGKVPLIMPGLRAEPKKKGEYDSTKKTSAEISHSESHHSQFDPSPTSDSYPPQMMNHTLSEANMSSSLPTQNRAAQTLLGASSPLATQLGVKIAPKMPTRNLLAPKSAPKAPWIARGFLSIPRSNGPGGDSDIFSFRDEEGKGQELKAGGEEKWRAFLPKIWVSAKEKREVQGITTEWNWARSGEGEKGGIMTARGRLERYM